MSLKERDERTNQELKRNARRKKTRQPRTRTRDVRKQQAPEEYAPYCRPTPSISAEPHFHQYKIFHAIDRLVRGLFDLKKRSRTSPDSVNQFVDEVPGTLNNSAPSQLVEDKCIDIVHLSEARIDVKVKAALEDIFKALKTATRSHESDFPDSLLKDMSRSVEHSPSPADLLRKLLVPLRFPTKLVAEFPQAKSGSRQPLCDPHRLSPPSCRVIIQKMGLDCAKHRKSRFKTDPNVLESQEEHFSRCLEDSDSTNTVQEISLLYDYTCAMSKDKYNSETLAYRVSRPLSLTAGICQQGQGRGASAGETPHQRDHGPTPDIRDQSA